MKVVGNKKVLDDFKRRHADARSHVDAWICEAKEAEWESPHDIMARYATARILPNNGVVFKLKGNSYRLYVKVIYVSKVVRIKRIGTHAEYDNWKL